MSLTLDLPPAPLVIDDVTRRRFLALAAASGLVTACGAPTPAAAPAAATAVVRTPLGDVTIPVRPQRVVAMYANDVDLAVALGLPLVGAGTANGAGSPEAFAAHTPASALGTAAPLRTYPEADYEAVAALRPDLVLDSVADTDGRYARLSSIAPTVNYHDVVFGTADGGRPDWRAALGFLAAPLGKGPDVDRFVREQAERAAVVGARLRAAAVGSVAIVTPSDSQLSVLVTASSFLWQIVEGDLGLTPAPVVRRLRAGTGDEVTLSAERIGEVDADTLVVLVYPDDQGTLDRSGQLRSVTSNPFWGRLPAVRAGRVVLVPSELNFPSPLAARSVVDALDAGL